MAELILVRHGQANSDATDEISYDRLSSLGRQQAAWLGAHKRSTALHFDRVITGTLNRQVGTAQEMGFEISARDARLNEMSYFDLAKTLEVEHGIPQPKHTTEYVRHLPMMMEYWRSDRLEGVGERYGRFAARVTDVIEEQCAAKGRAMLVTSGGVIGMAMAYTLGLDHGAQSKVMLQIMNSSVHRLEHVHGALMVGGFNATPHLDGPERAHARTYV